MHCAVVNKLTNNCCCCFSFLFQLRALTQVLHLPIEVIQASSATIKIGEEFGGEPVTLVYVVYILICLLGVQVVLAKLFIYMKLNYKKNVYI